MTSAKSDARKTSQAAESAAPAAKRARKPLKATAKPVQVIRDAAAPPRHFTSEQIERAVRRAIAEK